MGGMYPVDPDQSEAVIGDWIFLAVDNAMSMPPKRSGPSLRLFLRRAASLRTETRCHARQGRPWMPGRAAACGPPTPNSACTRHTAAAAPQAATDKDDSAPGETTAPTMARKPALASQARTVKGMERRVVRTPSTLPQ